MRDVNHTGEYAREETRLRGDAPVTSSTTIEEGLVVVGHECDASLCDSHRNELNLRHQSNDAHADVRRRERYDEDKEKSFQPRD